MRGCRSQIERAVKDQILNNLSNNVNNDDNEL